MKKQVLAIILSLGLIQGALSSASAETAAEQKQAIQGKIAAVNLKLATINKQLEAAESREDLVRAGNSLVIGGETFAAVGLLLDIKTKQYAKASEKAKYLTAILAAHISYMKISPSRTDGKEESELRAQKAQLVQMLNELQVELAGH